MEREAPRAAVVFGGGGMKGLAHIGAWKAIDESGFRVTRIVGTSIGALVGACIAAGDGWRELVPRALAVKRTDVAAVNRWALLLNGIRQPNVLRGDRLRTLVERVLPAATFDDLALPLSVNAVDLETGGTVWFGADGRTDAPLADAIYASCALPVFYPPVEIGGRYFVDGAVRDALPIDRAADTDADVVVAVDVGAGGTDDAERAVGKGMIALHHRVFDIMCHQRRRRKLERWRASPRLVYVRPELDGYSSFEFERTKYFLEEGYRAAREALARREEAVPGPAGRGPSQRPGAVASG